MGRRKHTAKAQGQQLADAMAHLAEAIKAMAWRRWLACEFNSYRELGKVFGIDDKTAKAWCSEFLSTDEISEPPSATAANAWGSIQHFDVWSFASNNREGGGQLIAASLCQHWAGQEPITC